MDIPTIVQAIRQFPGVTRKRIIADIVRELPVNGHTNVIADFGEDAAVLSYDECSQNDEVLLFAADSIWGRLIESEPRFAGYCSVLVNLNDIAAMGGKPLAMVDNLSICNRDIYPDIMKGISDGVKKFGVPVVGGHVNPDCADNTIDISVIGRAKRDEVIFSSTAQPGDAVIFAVDLDGAFHPAFKYAWDSTSKKSSETVMQQLDIMHEIGRRKLASAAKDISNPGYLGTLGMLLESSGVGARVDVTKIPCPETVRETDFTTWLQSYPGFAYVLTCRPENADEIVTRFEHERVSAAIAGSIEPGTRFVVGDGNEEKTLFDFSSDSITGIRGRTVSA